MNSKHVFPVALLGGLVALMGCTSAPRETGITILSPPAKPTQDPPPPPPPPPPPETK